ncbi:hypothetical protein [uncultured Marivirga sp.]|uniref:hypothetical protein n=1 Tax=uncultured Marivirga sp. TaxID=1123707 RepID=UPI0030EF050F|tara:strand:+ start:118716 stop:119435 length:720 start_codon:yes stop_codon:yes gene_type:complete
MKILLLCGNTNRAKSYVDVLSKLDFVELSCLYYYNKESFEKNNQIQIDEASSSYLNHLNVITPNLSESLVEKLSALKLDYDSVEEYNVNAPFILNKIKDVKPDYVVYAGYGGQILSPAHFDLEIDYLHAHPGWLPEERGSTTLYYSLLKNKPLSVTTFFMSAEIDKGGYVNRINYPQPTHLVDIDNYIDNALRADSMKKALSQLNKAKEIHHPAQDEEDQEYYVIHPLLKHVALLSIDN